MSKYAEQKENLENQGWRIYQSMGGKSYFNKKDISGLVVMVDQATGAAELHKGCPESFANKHKPTLIGA